MSTGKYDQFRRSIGFRRNENGKWAEEKEAN